jgi:RND family efflux transporter MFP subunit
MIVSFTIALALLSACQQKEGTYVKPTTLVSTEVVKEFIPQTETRYSAVVQPSEQIDLAFKVSGYVQSIFKIRGSDGKLRNVQEGDYVRKGTVLARIEQSDYLARVNQQRAAVNEVRFSQERVHAGIAEAQVALQQARDEFARSSRLFAADSITKPEYEAAKSRVEIAEARLKDVQSQLDASKATEVRSKAGLREVQVALKDCTLSAPFDGTVVKRNIEEGSLTAQGAVDFTLANSGRAKVAFGVPDVELRSLSMNQQVSITCEAIPGKSFQGYITQISPAADPRSRVFNVEVTVPETGMQLKSGMIASLAVSHVGDVKPALSIPLDAVVKSSRDPSSYAVYIVQAQSNKYIAEERSIQLGEASGERIAVLNGLKPGDRIVTNGSARISDGQEIRLADQIGKVQ